MSHGIPYFSITNGIPRWDAPKRFRPHIKGRYFVDTNGNPLPLVVAMAEARKLNAELHVKENGRARPIINEDQARAIITTRQARNGYIYFVRFADAIKIGYSRNPCSRVQEIQNGLSGKPCGVFMVEGSLNDELLVHKRLANFKIEREWYHPEPRLINFLAHSMIAGEFRWEVLNKKVKLRPPTPQQDK